MTDAIRNGSRTDVQFSEQSRMDWEAFFQNYRNPDFIPGYAILNKLGSGVFGEVYKARKTSIGKLYAIKFLKVADERLSDQVLRELETVDHFAQVDHPNLVSIEDRGEVEGIPFIVMGYAGDETLKVLLSEGVMDRGRAAALFRQVLKGVQALHEHSIIHFDLKPANVFIKGDVARVGDYGLSKLMSESRATLSMGRGTPNYMAPEMLQRRGDARSDVYSLGVIFFEMLTGDVPFKGDSEWEILRRHETETPQIPDTVPEEYRAFLFQCLDKDPARRFTSAGAQLAAFDAATASVFGTPGGSTLFVPPVPSVDPEPINTAAQLGETVGRVAARGRVTFARVRTELQEVLERVRRETKDAWVAARHSYSRDLRAARKQVPSDGDARPTREERRLARRLMKEERRAGRRPRGPMVRLVRGLTRLVLLPFQVAIYTVRNLIQVAVALVIAAGLCGLVHLGLSAAIR